MTDKVPYALRHTFAAWSLMIGIDMNRLVKLMGMLSSKWSTRFMGSTSRGWKRTGRLFWSISERIFSRPREAIDPATMQVKVLVKGAQKKCGIPKDSA